MRGREDSLAPLLIIILQKSQLDSGDVSGRLLLYPPLLLIVYHSDNGSRGVTHLSRRLQDDATRRRLRCARRMITGYTLSHKAGRQHWHLNANLEMHAPAPRI